ncbi:MAG: hypothetical protein ACI9YE_003874 [Psychroserpens sp.]|jgi:hypothetical protein
MKNPLNFYIENALISFFFCMTLSLFLKLSAIFFGLSFELFSYFSFAILIFFLFLTIKLSDYRASNKLLHNEQSRQASIILALLSLAVGLFTSYNNFPEPDDSFYVSGIVYYLANPMSQISADINWLVPWSKDVPIWNLFLPFTQAYEYFIGSLSYILGIDFLWTYQVFGSFVWGAIFVYVTFNLFNRFFKGSEAVFGTFMVLFATLFIFRDGGVGYGVLLGKIWIGKAIVWLIIIPFIATLTYDYIVKPTRRNWFFLFFSVTSSLAFSPSSISLIPALLIVLAISSIFDPKQSCRKDKFFVAFKIASSGGLLVLIGFFLKFQLKNLNLASIVDSSRSDLFESSFRGFFGDFTNFPAIILYVSFVILIANYKKIGFLTAWMIGSLLIFINPLTSNLIAANITSEVAYARIFFIAPWIIAVGVLFIYVYRFCNKFKNSSSTVSSIFIFVTTLSLVYLFGWSTLKISFSVAGNTYWLGPPTYEFPRVKIDKVLFEDSKYIASKIPAGNTLETMEYALSIPMVSGRHPQYYSNPHSSILTFGEMSNNEPVAQKRIKGIEFLLGNGANKKEFESLIKTDAVNLVINSYINERMNINEIALKNGFYEVEKTDRYVLYTLIDSKL